MALSDTCKSILAEKNTGDSSKSSFFSKNPFGSAPPADKSKIPKFFEVLPEYVNRQNEISVGVYKDLFDIFLKYYNDELSKAKSASEQEIQYIKAYIAWTSKLREYEAWVNMKKNYAKQYLDRSSDRSTAIDEEVKTLIENPNLDLRVNINNLIGLLNKLESLVIQRKFKECKDTITGIKDIFEKILIKFEEELNKIPEFKNFTQTIVDYEELKVIENLGKMSNSLYNIESQIKIIKEMYVGQPTQADIIKHLMRNWEKFHGLMNQLYAYYQNYEDSAKILTQLKINIKYSYVTRFTEYRRIFAGLQTDMKFCFDLNGQIYKIRQELTPEKIQEMKLQKRELIIRLYNQHAEAMKGAAKDFETWLKETKQMDDYNSTFR